ncbi:MAG: haloacid dehalogenase-like hydrolase [Deltaproteobacteria bacterium]|nr:haloacid dehalogenase-like hydrolase [Deltaproteobacteria bacterium]
MRQKVIAVVFDFDDTLAHDSTSGFLDTLGIDVKDFWDRHKKLLSAEWDPIPAYLHMMVQESRRRPAKERITQSRLRAWGKKIEFHPGVGSIFERMRKQARAISAEIKLEFYVISSGIGEIIRNTSIAKQFTDIWASDFSYTSSGEIDALRNVVSFTDKTRFIFQISKGIVGAPARRDPFAVNRKVPNSELRVPLDQMIFVGDGYTDVPCFSLAQRNGGVAIGVYDRKSRERWGKAWGFIEDHRVQHLVAADYRKHSGLDDALSMAIDKIANNIALRALTYQG